MTGTLSPEDYAQQQQIIRQQRMADMLMSQNQQPQGQMVSGRYVAPNIFQQLQPVANMLTGAYLAKQGDTRAAALAEAIRGRNATEAQDIVQTLRGTPAQAGNLPLQGTTQAIGSIEEPVGEYKAPVSGIAGNKDLALMKALKSTSPIAANIANTLITKSLEGPKFHNVAQGASLLQETPEGGIKPLYTNPKEVKPPTEIELALSLNRSLPRDPATWTQADANAAKQTIIEYNHSKRSVNTNYIMPEQKTFENTQKLRQQFNSEPVYKAFQEVNSAYSKINDGLNMKSPAGDLAAATKFMKLLDEGSVVRESELLLAMKATGALDRLQNYAQNVVKGTKLTPTQRDDFRKLSTDFYNSSATQYNSKQAEYVDIAKRYNFNPLDVTSAPIKLESTSNTQYAVNKKTNERIMSNDGGKTWSKAQ